MKTVQINLGVAEAKSLPAMDSLAVKEEYFFYLVDAQGSAKMPTQTYKDAYGLEVLSFDDWLKTQ